MDYIENFLLFLGNRVKDNISNEIIASALADGILSSVGVVVTFLPNVVILFLA